MVYEKKYLGAETSGLDAESADFAVGANDYINCENIRTLTTDVGVTKDSESIASNLLIPNPYLPAGTNLCIGGAVDRTNRRLIPFMWNSNGNHGIFCYDYIRQGWYIVLLDADLVNGLNFDRNQLVHSAWVENGCLYWVNALQNEPGRLDVNAAINLYAPGAYPVAPYTSPINFSVIRWIRRQPQLPPSWQKFTDLGTMVNFIATEAFQFSWRYIYRNYEISTLSPESTLANFNSAADTFNYIVVQMPVAEPIDQDVIEVDLVANYLNSGIYFVIRSWLKVIPADATAIANHNNGSVPLTFNFYNDTLGIALDAVYSVKPFDSVPIFAQTTSVAKQRGFMANYVIGYDTPTTTSLAITLDEQSTAGGGGDPVGNWYFLEVHYSMGTVMDNILYLPEFLVPGHGGYYAASGVPPFPPTIPWASLTFLGATIPAVIAGFGIGTPYTIIPPSPPLNSLATSTVTGAPIFPPTAITRIAFKSAAAYQASITFYDYGGRKCGYLTNDTLLEHIPDRAYDLTTYTQGLLWSLDNTNALAEIPPWAYSYSINVTKCLRTRFFIQARGANITYYSKAVDGTLTYNTANYAANLTGIAVNVSLLFTYAMGYVFSPGDEIKIYLASTATVYTLAVTGQDGSYVLCQLQDIGNIGNDTTPVLCIFEIYTPYKRQSNEPSWETGQIFLVNNPATAGRSYSVIAGEIFGDITILVRTDVTTPATYYAEAMSPNDKYYLLWYTNSGRPNFIDRIGQVTKVSSVDFSNTFIPGSKVNGLSTFDPLDTKDISPDYGPVMKLQLTSKIQKTGSVMLAICGGGETASMYLSEHTLISNTGDTTVGQSDSVIGTVNALKGSSGTLNPESVSEYKGEVWWWDIQNGKVAQYADNGLFMVSNYKFSRVAKLFSQAYKALTQGQVEAFGNRPFIFGCMDPHHGEVLFSIPKVLATPPKGFLPDYPSTVYPFDIWDGRGKTLVYKLVATPNHWQGAITMNPDYMFYLEDELYAFYQGNLYIMNQPSNGYANFFGTQYKSRIMFLGNQAPNKPKALRNISVEANMLPSFTYFRSEFPNVQASDLGSEDFTVKEGQAYCQVYRDKLTPGAPSMQQALISGDEIRAVAIKILMEFSVTDTPVELKFINLGYTLSLGHTT